VEWKPPPWHAGREAAQAAAPWQQPAAQAYLLPAPMPDLASFGSSRLTTPPQDAQPPQKLQRSTQELGTASALALLEDVAAQRRVSAQVQAWKEPPGRYSDRARHVVNIIWDGKVVGSGQSEQQASHARLLAAEAAVERLRLFQSAASTLGARSMAQCREVSPKDIARAHPMDEHIWGALKAAALPPGRHIRLKAFSNLLGYSERHRAEAEVLLCDAAGQRLLVAGGFGTNLKTATRMALHIMFRLMHASPEYDVVGPLKSRFRGGTPEKERRMISTFNQHAGEVADGTAHVEGLPSVVLGSHIAQ
jgi:hypothetical protein